MDIDDINRGIANLKSELNYYNKNRWKNRKRINILKKNIQASEAYRYVYTTQGITPGAGSSGSYTPKENLYQTYSSMVEASNEMYMGECSFGVELYGALMTSRVAFIGGDGPTAVSTNPNVQKWANEFLKINKLTGERHIRFLESGEMEGKHLMTLSPTKQPPKWINNGTPYISVSGFSWYDNQYTVKKDTTNSDIIKSITYKGKSEMHEEKSISWAKSVFVQLGGKEDDCQNTVYGMHRCLTQIENASRAMFDLRRVSNLYGFPKPTWKFQPGPNTQMEIDTISKRYEGGPVPPNEGYIGTADFNYKSPEGGAETLLEDIKMSFRTISINTGLPIHFLAWPELMSNRATAENLLELINNKTSTPRMIWEAAYREMLFKARLMTIEQLGVSSIEGLSPGELSEFLTADITVKLPLASLHLLKLIQDLWVPLFEGKIVAKKTIRNMLPGIDPELEEIQVLSEKEKQENDRTEEPQPGEPGNSDNADSSQQAGPQDDDRRDPTQSE